MLHNAHVYIASKLFNSKEDLLYIGSFLPDIAVTGIVSWDKGLHGKKTVESLYKFIRGQYPNYLGLYKGVLAHNVLDDFTHENYRGERGYAYQNNQKLAKQVKNYYGLDNKKAVGIAHNYIETGVDIMLLGKNPDLPGKIEKATKSVDSDELSGILGSYFKIESDRFKDSLLMFFDQFTKYDLTEFENWSSFWKDLERSLSLRNIGRRKREKLILTSIEIVKGTYSDFLDYSLREGLKEINKYEI